MSAACGGCYVGRGHFASGSYFLGQLFKELLHGFGRLKGSEGKGYQTRLNDLLRDKMLKERLTRQYADELSMPE